MALIGNAPPRHAARLLLAALLLAAGPAWSDTPAPRQAVGDRQVTLFGIVASETDRGVDPKLAEISYQLRKLKPGYGFQLRGVISRRLAPGESLACDLGDGLAAVATLSAAPGDPAKVRLAFRLDQADRTVFRTAVTTPPNQLFFCEKPLADGTRLLIGIGAR